MNEEKPTTSTGKAKRKPSPRTSATKRAKKAAPTLSKSYCTNCGQELSRGDKFCQACGTKVVQEGKSKTKDEPLPDTQLVPPGTPAEVTGQSEPPPIVPEQVEEPVAVVEPDGKKKKRKKEQVDYEALLMANMPEDVQRRMPIVTFALIGVSVLFAIIMLCATGSFNPDPQDFIDYGANYHRLTFDGQLWRLVTSSFLHFGFQHLAFNMLCLFALGRFLEKMAGHANLLCVYLLTACTGGVLSLCFHDDAVCAGASGAVFGVFGASITLVALLWRKYCIDPKHMWGYMKNGLAFVGINFIYSLFPGVDMAGHIGGLLGGLAVGGALAVPLLMEGKPFGKWFQQLILAKKDFKEYGKRSGC